VKKRPKIIPISGGFLADLTNSAWRILADFYIRSRGFEKNHLVTLVGFLTTKEICSGQTLVFYNKGTEPPPPPLRLHPTQCIPTRGNLFLPVCLLVWADGRGTVPRADSAARAELHGAPKQKLLQLKNRQKIPLGQAQGDAYLLF
jgi:hypothetical protein